MEQNPTEIDPSQWVEAHGDVLFRFALARIRDEELAAELVQETFLAGVRALDSFKGQSSIQTWLVAILKRKIIDHLRKAQRESTVRTETPADKDFSEFFDERGHWTKESAPSSWNIDPAEALSQKDFMAVLHNCLSKMPSKLRDAFVLRELEEATSDEIMENLQISSSNLWVLLHRARLKLRECVEANWLSSQ